MQVEIVTFPETRVAVIEHRGPPALEYESLGKLIAWKLERQLLDQARFRSYGLHYADPFTTPPDRYRVDFCLSVDEDVAPNRHGIGTAVIPALRCAHARDLGSRSVNRAAAYLWNAWLPASGEAVGDFPMIFHYVNVGPKVSAEEMVTDVYLPLR